MSTPEKPNDSMSIEKLLSSAHFEILSASSSLHMDCEEISDRDPEDFFLSDRFVYAKHAVEHIRAASHFIGLARNKEQKEREEKLWDEIRNSHK